jgi:hypothetical protein
MADSSGSFHESPEQLSDDAKDRHRAIVSCMEEMEAVDWYDQRVEAATSPELAEILAHNRDEEKEHAAMVLEWLRRNDPVWDEQLRTYLFSDGPILEAEEAVTSDEGASGEGNALGEILAVGGDLGIGSLKGRSE